MARAQDDTAGAVEVGIDDPAHVVGQRFGRYRITELIGSGGMGTVYAGVDEALQRSVAIKILPRQRAADAARLVREAQALAALSHPNVVTVFEVGKQHGRHFIAMEHVRGMPMDRWLTGGPHWTKVLSIMLQAGEGLAAAHERGLIHRDFKPANVILGDDGRARVLDFGLVVVGDSSDGSAHGSVATGSPHWVTDTAARQGELTGDGIILGTPAYMAPEQFTRALVGPATDQWAFCVTLYESVFHRRPFALGTLEDMRRRVLAGVGPRPTEVAVPRWLWRAIRRGLSRAPGDRWSSMRELLDALQRGARPRRRVLALGAVAVAGVVGAAMWRAPASTPPCAGEIEEHWNDEARTAVRRAFDHAAQGSDAEVILAAIDGVSQQWSVAAATVCEPSARHQASAPHDFDRRIACLAARKRELAAAVEALASADRYVVGRAGDLLDGLQPPAWCATAEQLEASMLAPADPAVASRVASVRVTLQRVRTLVALDRPDEARPWVAEAVREAEAAGYGPAILEAKLSASALEGALGETERAIAGLSEVYWSAIEAEHDRAAAAAAWHLMEEIGRSGEYGRAREWARHSRAVQERTGALADLAPSLDRREAALLVRMGRYDEAWALLDRAVSTLAAETPTRYAELARCYTQRGNAERLRGRSEDAVRWLEQGTAMLESVYGAQHSQVGAGLVNLGLAHLDAGTIEAGREVLTRAIAIEERVHGPDHRDAPPVLMALAHAERHLGRVHVARELFTRARDIYVRSYGPDNVNVAYALEGLAKLERQTGRPAEAVALYERVVQLRADGLLAPTWLAQAQFGLAQALASSDREPERRTQLAQAALAVFEALGTGREADAQEVRDWLATDGR